MAHATDMQNIHPRVEMRPVLDRLEAYIPGTGLAVWEIAWIAGLYDRDIDATMNHFGYLQNRAVIEVGLRYADEHAEEIKAEIDRHTGRTLEELLELFPRMTVVDIDLSDPEEQPR